MSYQCACFGKAVAPAINVDADGGADNFVQVAYIYNQIGLTDEEALETSGNLITVYTIYP